jgi:hypothetical protein
VLNLPSHLFLLMIKCQTTTKVNVKLVYIAMLFVILIISALAVNYDDDNNNKRPNASFFTYFVCGVVCCLCGGAFSTQTRHKYLCGVGHNMS